MTISIFVSSCDFKNESQPERSEPPSATQPLTMLTGETKRFSYQGLEIEVEGVRSDRNETYQDDGGTNVNLIVITYLPGAKLTVLKPDMSDASFSEDGKPHAQWGIDFQSKQATGERYRITGETETLDITSDMLAIYNLEASLYVIKFEPYTP